VVWELGIAPEAVPALTAALADTDVDIRRGAAKAMGDLGPQAAPAVRALMNLLEDEDEEVRARAADALGSIGGEAQAAIPRLLAMLQENKGLFRNGASKSAALALGSLRAQPKAVVPALTAALRHPDAEVRSAAARGVGAFGDQARAAVPNLTELLKKGERLHELENGVQALRHIGPAAVEQAITDLTRALQNKDYEVRWRSAFSLGLLDVEGRSVPALIRVLREDEQVSFAAAWALGNIGPRARDAVPALVNHTEAAEALRKIDPDAAARAGVR
jgi:HEAT repeat protein